MRHQFENHDGTSITISDEGPCNIVILAVSAALSSFELHQAIGKETLRLASELAEEREQSRFLREQNAELVKIIRERDESLLSTDY